MPVKKHGLLPKEKAVSCLKCGRKFTSPNRQRIRICSVCKSRRDFR